MNERPSQSVNSKWHVLQHALDYFSSQAALALLGLVSIPVFTRLLLPSDYGLFQIFYGYVAIAAILLTVNVSSSVTRRTLESAGFDPSFLGTVLTFVIVAVTIVAGIALPFVDRLSATLGVPESLVYLLYPATLFTAIFQVFNSFCIATKKSKLYAVVSVARGYSAVALGALLAANMASDRFMGPVLGQVIVLGVVFTWVLKRLAAEAQLSVEKEHMTYMLGYSLPLVFYSLGNLVLGQLDRLMINKIIGSHEAGLYSLAYNVGLLLDLVGSALQSALVPFWFKHLNEGDRLRANELTDLNFRITLGFALALILFSEEIVLILADARFHEALHIIPVIVVGYVFNAAYKIYLREVSYSKRMWHVSLIAIIGAVANWLLNWWLIPLYGYQAAAFTTLLSFLLMVVLAWCVVRFFLRIETFPPRLLFGPGAWFLAGFASYYVVTGLGVGWLIAVPVKVGVLALLVGGLFGRQLLAWWDK